MLQAKQSAGRKQQRETSLMMMIQLIYLDHICLVELSALLSLQSCQN